MPDESSAQRPELLPPLPTKLRDIHALLEAHRLEYVNACRNDLGMAEDAALVCLRDFEYEALNEAQPLEVS